MNRIEKLTEYVKTIRDGISTKKDYQEYSSLIDNATPIDAFEIFSSLINEGDSESEILQYLDKVINVFYHSLEKYEVKESDYEFLNNLLLENNKLREVMNNIKAIIKSSALFEDKDLLLKEVIKLKEFSRHYVIIENILFPLMEKKANKFQGTSIMWALHNQVEGCLKDLIKAINNDNKNRINKYLGEIFFGYLGLAQKEELILFPSALEIFDENDWKQMHRQSLEYEWAFINIYQKNSIEMDEKKAYFSDKLFNTETGHLSAEQLYLMLNTLTVDLTFVDENDKVKFFTKPKDRIFPRSPAIIGREVKNCHPPDSVHIIEKILESFKNGYKNNAKFWINIKDKKILIQYFALRNQEGEYKGTLEISQDITEIKNLKDERRLLDW